MFALNGESNNGYDLGVAHNLQFSFLRGEPLYPLLICALAWEKHALM